MSCGKHHDTGCSEVIESVWVYLDGEIDEAQCAKIREHLDECSPCLRQFGIEKEVKALVARSCGSDHAPDDLKARVRAKLLEVRIEMTTVEYRAD